MRSSLAITLVILGVFLLMSPVLIPLFASAGDVKTPLMDGMERTLMPIVGVVMIVLGVVVPLMGRSKSDHEGGNIKHET